jgi:uncharacterized membrane protein
MTLPAPTPYHRWLGWQATALRRLAAATGVGITAGLVLGAIVPWHVALLGAWNALALTFLASVAPIILRSDSATTEHLAVREDVNRDVAGSLLLTASTTSIVAVSIVLHVARNEAGAGRALLVAMAALTLVVSWTVLNTQFTLRYAHLYYIEPADAVDFGGAVAGPPDYRDFAYLAFTIGMTYQVSDTSLRGRRIRHYVLVQALFSYIYGVAIVAAGVNIVAGLV